MTRAELQEALTARTREMRVAQKAYFAAARAISRVARDIEEVFQRLGVRVGAENVVDVFIDCRAAALTDAQFVDAGRDEERGSRVVNRRSERAVRVVDLDPDVVCSLVVAADRRVPSTLGQVGPGRRDRVRRVACLANLKSKLSAGGVVGPHHVKLYEVGRSARVQRSKEPCACCERRDTER